MQHPVAYLSFMVRAVLLLVLGLSQVGHWQAWKGVDASFLPEMLYDGVIYRDQDGAEIERRANGWRSRG